MTTLISLYYRFLLDKVMNLFKNRPIVTFATQHNHNS